MTHHPVMNRTQTPTSFALNLLLAGCASLMGCASGPPAPPAGVPASLQVPDSLVLSAALRGSGVQIYGSQAGPKDPARFAWVLKAPAADLSDRAGKGVGRHYAGPTWRGSDGSKVVGEVVARGDAPTADAIPWLLLRAKSTDGSGLFGDTAYIQRLHTVGGQPPADGCDAGHADQSARIPYSADYYFYVRRK